MLDITMKQAARKPHLKHERANCTSYATQSKHHVNISTLIYQEYVKIIVLYSLCLIE